MCGKKRRWKVREEAENPTGTERRELSKSALCTLLNGLPMVLSGGAVIVRSGVKQISLVLRHPPKAKL